MRVGGAEFGMSVCVSVQMVTRTKKMFVGGLSASTTIDDVKAYFESYGKVRASRDCWAASHARPAVC